MHTQQKPAWLTIRPQSTPDFSKIRHALRSRGLVTVCEEAHCPNMAECWAHEGTATFMVMGDTCTRGCKFCAISTAMKGQPLDQDEPDKIAEAVAEIGLDYVVLTSVDRDDLADGGAAHFAACIDAILTKHPKTHIEVLIPDFQGEVGPLKRIVEACPDVIGHNIETVRSLQHEVRDPRAGYEQSLKVLADVKTLDHTIYTKSSIMLGLGETEAEVIKAMHDLREVDVDILTLGQYLKPSNKVLPVKAFISPDAFSSFRAKAEAMGFLYVASGPFVRSSYRAGEFFMRGVLSRRRIHQSPSEVGLSQEQ
ncbi:MAG: lipoyl synthase [archaeon]